MRLPTWASFSSADRGLPFKRARALLDLLDQLAKFRRGRSMLTHEVSFRPDVCLLDDRPPLVDFGFVVGAERLRRLLF